MSQLAESGNGAQGGEDIVVPVPEAGTGANELDHYLGAAAAELASACGATRGAGDVASVAAVLGGTPRRLVFLGLGDGSPAQMRKAGAALGGRLTRGRRVLTSAVYGQPDEAVRAFAEALLLSAYRFSLAASTPDPGPSEVRALVSSSSAVGQVEHAITVATAVALARDLANMPSVRKSPAWLADEAVRVAADSHLSARIWEPDELATHGFGGLLAVGSGSAQPPRLNELGYQPPDWREHVVLVGKGITFDSGGLANASGGRLRRRAGVADR